MTKPTDLCGLSCVFVLAEIVRMLSAGDSTSVICDHPTTIHDTVPLFCKNNGYHLEVTPEIYPLDRQVYRLSISR